MKWIKRVGTPLTVVAKVIDSLSTNLNTRTNAPSIRAVQEMKENLETQIENADSQIGNILEQIYPVGAIYISTSITSPSTIFGGTWEKIEDKFLLASGSTYANGATGGEATHTLTEQEIPRHNHSYDKAVQVLPHSLTIQELPEHTHDVSIDCSTTVRLAGTSSNMLPTCEPENPHTYTSGSTGGGQGHNHALYSEGDTTGYYGVFNPSHNNMPPYLAVNMWVRVS